jgi:hypothetical protein
MRNECVKVCELNVSASQELSFPDVEPDSEPDVAGGVLGLEPTEDLIVQNCSTAVEVECAGSGQSADELVIDSGNQIVSMGLVESVQNKSIAANKFYAKRKISKPSRYAN